MWFDALRLMVWPHPLATLREPSQTSFWLAAIAQAALLGLCVFAWFRKRPEPILGLLFFYLAILPASRIVGEGALQPLLMDRMLYLPSVGLMLCLAAFLSWLARRFQPRLAIAVAAVLVLAFVPVTWARNGDWSNEIGLLENDFAVTQQNGQLMYALVRAQAADGNLERSIDLCLEHGALVGRYHIVANECGKAFTKARRYERAEGFYQQSLKTSPAFARTHFHLARLYVVMDRWRDAESEFKLAIQRERLPFLREFMSGIMLMDLYPHDRDQLQRARQHMQNALEIQPRAAQAREMLEQLDSRL
jgi:tetratricopeptide (TPR) repeat protein